MKEEKTYYGVIVLFYKGRGEGRGFLVVENSKTGNVTFVSGTQEAEDRDLLATAQREIKEELGLDSNSYQLEPTDVYHNFVYGSKYCEYIEYISKTLKSFGIKQSGKISKIINKKRGNISYHYGTSYYAELLAFRKQWYPNGKKIVPRNIRLTPLTCRQWYIGDGCLMRGERGRPRITLATYSFPILDVKWLIEKLKKLGFKATRRKYNNTIGLSSYSTKDFLNYIGKCPISCYQYKFNYEMS